jgi:hypothetical protein
LVMFSSSIIHSSIWIRLLLASVVGGSRTDRSRRLASVGVILVVLQAQPIHAIRCFPIRETVG